MKEKKILLVDDSPFMRKVIKKALIDSPYVLDEAEEGQEALEKYKREHHDLILSDVAMPGWNGETFLEELKKYEADAKIVMCSSMVHPHLKERLLQKGATDFLGKPFNTEQLLKTVENWIKDD